MNKILYIFLILITVTNCTPKKVVKHHGVPYLEKKQNSLIINESNKNDVIKLLGNPSTKSLFNENIWVYIERKQTQSKLNNLGKMEIYKNDILEIEFDSLGIIINKKMYDIDKMENIKISKDTTETINKRKSFLYDFMSSMRQKANDPLGQRAKKRREANQQ